MMRTWLTMAGVMGALLALMVVLKLVERWLKPPAELTRKLLHVGMGLVVLSFPWVFDRQWPVILLSALATAALLATRWVPRLRDGMGTVLSGVQRASLGEIYFVLAVGCVFWLSERDPLLYCLPMLIMVLADATAALIGLAYGKVRFVTSDGLKSAEGSIAFFSIAFLCVHVPLLLLTDTGRTETLLIALIIGILSMLVEAISWRGLDNLLIPLGAFAFLKQYLHQPADALALRLGATVVLMAWALSWRRRSSLDDSALMAGALFGYGALMLGGGLWLIGPVVLFIIHALIWPRIGGQPRHSVLALLAVIATALLWLALNVREPRSAFFYAYATTFGAHLAIFGISYMPPAAAAWLRAQRVGGWTLAGWALALVQVMPVVVRTEGWTVAAMMAVMLLLGVAAGALIFDRLRPWAYDPRTPMSAPHWLGLAAGLAGSAIVAAVSARIAAG